MLSLVADSRCSCAADGGRGGRGLQLQDKPSSVEQVIAVPTIDFHHRVPLRTVPRETQTVEQLVDVPVPQTALLARWVPLPLGLRGVKCSQRSRGCTVGCRVRSTPLGPRGQTTARAAAGVQHFCLDLDDAPAAGGSRPDQLLEVRPQERVQRRTVEQIILAPMLDVPVPLMEEQLLVDAFAPHDIRVPEQVIEVPKLLPDDVPLRTAVRDTQLAEQPAEVPTIISFFSLQRIVEQNVDIPSPYGGVRGLQGFLPGQDSTSLLLSLERISERNVEQIVDSRGFGGGLQDFLPGQSSSSSSHDPARVHEVLNGPGEWFFRTFLQNKKSATVGPHLSPRVPASVSPSTPGAHVDRWVDGDEVWSRIDSVHGPFWKRLLSDHV